MSYIKVTDELPPVGEEVWTFNGEFEIKNEWDGKRFKYEFTHPTTHWTRKPSLPSLEQVQEVRKLLNG